MRAEKQQKQIQLSGLQLNCVICAVSESLCSLTQSPEGLERPCALVVDFSKLQPCIQVFGFFFLNTVYKLVLLACKISTRSVFGKSNCADESNRNIASERNAHQLDFLFGFHTAPSTFSIQTNWIDFHFVLLVISEKQSKIMYRNAYAGSSSIAWKIFLSLKMFSFSSSFSFFFFFF